MPEGADALGIMLGDPVAHEAGLDGDGDLAVALAQQGQGLQPAAKGRLAEFAAQPAADLGPLARENGNRPRETLAISSVMAMPSVLDPGQSRGLPAARLAAMALGDRGCPRSPRPRCSSAGSPPRSRQPAAARLRPPLRQMKRIGASMSGSCWASSATKLASTSMAGKTCQDCSTARRPREVRSGRPTNIHSGPRSDIDELSALILD